MSRPCATAPSNRATADPRLPGLLATLLLLAMPRADAATTVHRYDVRVADDLSFLRITAQLDGPVSSLRAQDSDGRGNLSQLRTCDGTALRVRRGRIALDGRPDACVRYDYRLPEKADGRIGRQVQLRDRLHSPSQWLWRPPLGDGVEIQVRFDKPADINVSVPWPALRSDKQVYRLGPSPRSSTAQTAFGAFDYHEVPVAGAVLRVSLLRGEKPYASEPILRWLRASAMDVAQTYGRFPNPSPQIIVVPVGGDNNEAVPFGRVIRDGGEAVQFFVNPSRPLEEFLDDWTATHEFSHLLLPYVEAKWISEGFASYYQNVLMARGGAYTEQRAWQKLYEGFDRGARSAPNTSPNRARMSNGGLMKIYWSGAALALLADVKLREASDGKDSLDAVLGRLQACCLPSPRSWTGRAFFQQLDKLTATPVFEALYDSYADSPGFPSLRNTWHKLGVRAANGRVSLDDDAPAAELRSTIMRTIPSHASTRGERSAALTPAAARTQ